MKCRLPASIACLAGLALAPAARAKITIDLDYSLDQNNANFFSPATPNGQAARAALSAAAHVYEDRLLDNLTAITSGGINSWTTDFTNPGNGTANWSINNLSIPPNTLKVYVAGRSLGGAIGIGGPGGYKNGIGDPAFQSSLQYRGQSGAQSAPATDFGPWGGAISFDNSVAWNFDLAGPANDKNDFLTVATHELAHVLGLGTSPAWKTRLTATIAPSGFTQYVGPFTGPKSVALYGGSVPLESVPAHQTGQPLYNAAHFKPGTMSTVNGLAQETIMDPDITIGTRKKLTLLDWAALDDIGWDLARPGDADANGAVGFSDLVRVAQNYGINDGQRRWSEGDFNYDGNVGFDDLVTVAQNYDLSGPMPGASDPLMASSFSADWEMAMALASPAPEPASLALLALPALWCAGRRRRA